MRWPIHRADHPHRTIRTTNEKRTKRTTTTTKMEMRKEERETIGHLSKVDSYPTSFVINEVSTSSADDDDSDNGMKQTQHPILPPSPPLSRLLKQQKPPNPTQNAKRKIYTIIQTASKFLIYNPTKPMLPMNLTHLSLYGSTQPGVNRARLPRSSFTNLFRSIRLLLRLRTQTQNNKMIGCYRLNSYR